MDVIGSGTTDDTGHVTITPTKPIPGCVTAKATDNAEHPNVASQPKKQLIQRRHGDCGY